MSFQGIAGRAGPHGDQGSYLLHACSACMMAMVMCCTIGSQVRQLILDWREATGPCKARALAQQLWGGEEFYLQARRPGPAPACAARAGFAAH